MKNLDIAKKAEKAKVKVAKKQAKAVFKAKKALK